MSATKLLVLGVARMFQPVHGYVVRRELLTWNVDLWANIKPGSIYGAMRTLAKEGCLAEVGTETEGGRPARTTYRVTEDGEVKFFNLFRYHLWRNVDTTDTGGFLAALSFMWVASRYEVIAAMDNRANLLEGCIKECHFTGEQLAKIPEKPEHVIEHIRFQESTLRGQLEWTRAFAKRLDDGAYTLAGEPGIGGMWYDELAKRGVVALDEHGAPLE